jgi:hypothetical protein
MAMNVVFFPFFQAFTDNGYPLAGGTLETYENKTMTQLPTYPTPLSDDVTNPWPITLSASGKAECQLFFTTSNNMMRMILRDRDGVVQWVQDDVRGLGTGGGGLGKGMKLLSQFNDLRDAIDTIGEFEDTTLFLDVEDKIEDKSLVVPDNIAIVHLFGAELTVSDELSVIFRGGYAAGNYRTFNCSERTKQDAAIVFECTNLQSVNPVWWYDEEGDWTAAIQAAIYSHTTVVFDSFEPMTVSKTLNLYQDSSLKGNGSTVLKLAAESILEKAMMVISETENVTLEGITLDGNSIAGQVGLTIEDASYVTLKSCTFQALPLHCIKMGRKTTEAAYAVQGVSMEDIIFMGIPHTGLHMDSCSDITLRMFSGGNGHSTQVGTVITLDGTEHKSKRILITDINMSGMAKIFDFIDKEQPEPEDEDEEEDVRLVWESNFGRININDCTFDNISALGTFSGNSSTIQGISAACKEINDTTLFTFQGGENANISGIDLASNGAGDANTHGFDIQNTEGLVLSACTVRKCTGIGFKIKNAGDMMMSSCFARTCGGVGFDVEETERAKIASCSVKDCEGIGFDVENSEGMIMTDLSVRNCGDIGYNLIDGVGLMMSSCYLDTSGKMGVNFAAKDKTAAVCNGTIKGCTITKAGGIGIQVAQGSTLVSGNTISKCKNMGIVGITLVSNGMSVLNNQVSDSVGTIPLLGLVAISVSGSSFVNIEGNTVTLGAILVAGLVLSNVIGNTVNALGLSKSSISVDAVFKSNISNNVMYGGSEQYINVLACEYLVLSSNVGSAVKIVLPFVPTFGIHIEGGSHYTLTGNNFRVKDGDSDNGIYWNGPPDKGWRPYVADALLPDPSPTQLKFVADMHMFNMFEQI